jgi:hypothetical protein
LPDRYPSLDGGEITDGSAKRADLRGRVEDVAVNYYARLQKPDGSWRWTSSEDNTFETMYVFHMGMFVEGLITVHEVSNNPVVKSVVQAMITRLAAHLYNDGVYRENEPIVGTDVKWRSLWYFYHGGTNQGTRREYETGGGSWTGPLPYSDMIRENRQLNCLVVHMYGYAYKISGDQRFREWGDEMFASAFGNGQGPLSDSSYSLADFREKEYSQCYRSAGHYLAWRAGY